MYSWEVAKQRMTASLQFAGYPSRDPIRRIGGTVIASPLLDNYLYSFQVLYPVTILHLLYWCIYGSRAAQRAYISDGECVDTTIMVSVYIVTYMSEQDDVPREGAEGGRGSNLDGA